MPNPTATPLTPEQMRTAITSREQLIRFLTESGRRFWVMDNADLVRSLPEPLEAGVEAVQQLINCYRDFRQTQPSGFVEPHGAAPEGRAVVWKTEMLEPEELEALIEWAQVQRAKALEQRAARGAVPAST